MGLILDFFTADLEENLVIPSSFNIRLVFTDAVIIDT
jgi:hypothetical protein